MKWIKINESKKWNGETIGLREMLDVVQKYLPIRKRRGVQEPLETKTVHLKCGYDSEMYCRWDDHYMSDGYITLTFCHEDGHLKWEKGFIVRDAAQRYLQDLARQICKELAPLGWKKIRMQNQVRQRDESNWLDVLIQKVGVSELQKKSKITPKLRKNIIQEIKSNFSKDGKYFYDVRLQVDDDSDKIYALTFYILKEQLLKGPGPMETDVVKKQGWSMAKKYVPSIQRIYQFLEEKYGDYVDLSKDDFKMTIKTVTDFSMSIKKSEQIFAK